MTEQIAKTFASRAVFSSERVKSVRPNMFGTCSLLHLRCLSGHLLRMFFQELRTTTCLLEMSTMMYGQNNNRCVRRRRHRQMRRAPVSELPYCDSHLSASKSIEKTLLSTSFFTSLSLFASGRSHAHSFQAIPGTFLLPRTMWLPSEDAW